VDPQSPDRHHPRLRNDYRLCHETDADLHIVNQDFTVPGPGLRGSAEAASESSAHRGAEPAKRHPPQDSLTITIRALRPWTSPPARL